MGLQNEIIRLEAKETLRTILAIQAAMSAPDDQDAKNMKVQLALQAFPDDEKTQATLIEALTRG